MTVTLTLLLVKTNAMSEFYENGGGKNKKAIQGQQVNITLLTYSVPWDLSAVYFARPRITTAQFY